MPVTVDAVDLGSGVGAWFTRRDPEGAATALAPAGNLSHHRPHSPATLARSRREVAAAIGYEPSRWHQMRQAHGSEVAVVDHRTTPGTELRHVDAAITALNDRPLVVTVADCVPVLLAGQTHVAAVHAGRQGLVAGVLPATVEALARTGEHVASLRAVVGPAIGPCCYEVPAALREEVAREHPVAWARTTWQTPALDLPTAVVVELRERGIGAVNSFGGCTRCDPLDRWFSHRADPSTGRFAGIVVRRSESSGHVRTSR
ncbi:MAG: polyphenol oxidase family protein [Nitriliruptoraceae bacterium]